jgi:hypothetical protein
MQIDGQINMAQTTCRFLQIFAAATTKYINTAVSELLRVITSM